jgi:DNA-binding MarR family transcriptional regulator
MSDFKHSDEYQITWLIRRLFRTMTQTADRYLESLGISASERAVMEFLSKRNQTVPQIAERYGVSRQHVQVTVNALLEDKLVCLEDNPLHKRSPLITLSTKGRRMFAKITKEDEKAIELAFSNISRKQCKQTRQTLEQLLDNLS